MPLFKKNTDKYLGSLIDEDNSLLGRDGGARIGDLSPDQLDGIFESSEKEDRTFADKSGIDEFVGSFKQAQNEKSFGENVSGLLGSEESEKLTVNELKELDSTIDWKSPASKKNAEDIIKRNNDNRKIRAIYNLKDKDNNILETIGSFAGGFAGQLAKPSNAVLAYTSGVAAAAALLPLAPIAAGAGAVGAVLYVVGTAFLENVIFSSVNLGIEDLADEKAGGLESDVTSERFTADVAIGTVLDFGIRVLTRGYGSYKRGKKTTPLNTINVESAGDLPPPKTKSFEQKQLTGDRIIDAQFRNIPDDNSRLGAGQQFKQLNPGQKLVDFKYETLDGLKKTGREALNSYHSDLKVVSNTFNDITNKNFLEKFVDAEKKPISVVDAVGGKTFFYGNLKSAEKAMGELTVNPEYSKIMKRSGQGNGVREYNVYDVKDGKVIVGKVKTPENAIPPDISSSGLDKSALDLVSENPALYSIASDISKMQFENGKLVDVSDIINTMSRSSKFQDLGLPIESLDKKSIKLYEEHSRINNAHLDFEKQYQTDVDDFNNFIAENAPEPKKDFVSEDQMQKVLNEQSKLFNSEEARLSLLGYMEKNHTTPERAVDVLEMIKEGDTDIKEVIGFFKDNNMSHFTKKNINIAEKKLGDIEKRYGSLKSEKVLKDFRNWINCLKVN